MEKLYPLKDLAKVKGKYSVSTLTPMGKEWWQGELTDGSYVVIAERNNKIKIKIANTEYELLTDDKILTVAKLNILYADLSFITVPPNNCQIKYILK